MPCSEAFLLWLCVLLTAIGTEQEEIQADYLEQVLLARLPLYIRRFGTNVMGLKPTDLKLFENGEPVEIQQLTPVSQELAIHILIDSSASNERMLERGKAAAARLIDELRPGDRCKVSSFSAYYEPHTAYSADKVLLRAALAKIWPRGSTALYDGILGALDDLSTLAGPRLLVIFTDGYDLMSRTGQAQLRTLVHNQGVPLLLVSHAKADEGRSLLVDQKEFLRSIVLISDGLVLDGNRPFERELVQALKHYRERYDLYYVPPASRDSRRWRSIEIRYPTCSDCVLSYRRGFRLEVLDGKMRQINR